MTPNDLHKFLHVFCSLQLTMCTTECKLLHSYVFFWCVFGISVKVFLTEAKAEFVKKWEEPAQVGVRSAIQRLFTSRFGKFAAYNVA
jgi:hypothetical protein